MRRHDGSLAGYRRIGTPFEVLADEKVHTEAELLPKLIRDRESHEAARASLKAKREAAAGTATPVL